MDPGRLLDDEALVSSAVVANCAMNRERQLAGPNSYTKELGFNPLDWIVARLRPEQPHSTVAWLDLCCGTGRALIQAAQQSHARGLAGRTVLVGVDLVDYFDPAPASVGPVHLISDSVTTWTPRQRFDLITCVHGLHYVGDKLAVLSRAAGWLTEDGLLVADLDLASVRGTTGPPLSRVLRQAGFTYDPRRRRVTCTGPREPRLPYAYRGADDRAGANYTHQPAVDSYYEPLAT
jgi:SAM-dependent methyltransferase